MELDEGVSIDSPKALKGIKVDCPYSIKGM